MFIFFYQAKCYYDVYEHEYYEPFYDIFVFYLRYEYRDTINELRSHLKEANKQILKEKTTELLDKNDDLNEVVSELSMYYVHIKKASEKTQELNEYLTNPDEEIVEKIKKTNKKSGDEKKFF